MAPASFRLIYVSTATSLLTAEELTAILETARRTNQRLAVTGMLLYKDGKFMQLLEGDEGRVRALYARIGQDPRHHSLTQVLDEPTTDRLFADWSMGFRNLSDPHLEAMPGYAPFRDVRLTRAGIDGNSRVCLDLLRFFKELP